MKHFILIFSLMACGIVVIYSCKKYQDPAPITSPRLTNHYCNDPLAVNYNWGFPGVADNTICFYPTDLFAGTYLYVDSVFSPVTGYYLSSDSLRLSIRKLSDTSISVFGFCPGTGDSLLMHAVGYTCSIDSTLKDTLSNSFGQFLCRFQDTVSGTFTDNTIDTTVHIYLQVISDTGTTLHIGRARKI